MTDSLAGEPSSSLSLGYLPPAQTNEVFISPSTPDQPPQSIPAPPGGTDGPSSTPAGAPPHTNSVSTPSHVFITVPTGSTPQSANVDQQPPALIPIPGSQQSGIETSNNESETAKALPPPTKRGRGRGRGRLGGRGRGGRSEQTASGGDFCDALHITSLWVWSAGSGEGVVVRRRRGRGRARLAIHDSTPRSGASGVVSGGNGLAGSSGSMITGGDGEDRGTRKKVSILILSCLTVSLRLSAAGREEESAGSEGQVRPAQEEDDGRQASAEGHSDPAESGSASEEGEGEGRDEARQR